MRKCFVVIVSCLLFYSCGNMSAAHFDVENKTSDTLLLRFSDNLVNSWSSNYRKLATNTSNRIITHNFHTSDKDYAFASYIACEENEDTVSVYTTDTVLLKRWINGKVITGKDFFKEMDWLREEYPVLNDPEDYFDYVIEYKFRITEEDL